MHLSFWPDFQRILHLLLVLNILEAWKNVHDFCGCHSRCWWSLFSEHCKLNQNQILQMSPRTTALPSYLWYWGSSSEFLRWQRSINDAKWTFLPLVLASLITSFLLLTSSAAMPEFSPMFPILSPLPPLHLDFFNAWGIGMNLCTRLQ